MSNFLIVIEESFQSATPIEELVFTPVDSKYRNVQLILTALGYTTLAAGALFLLLLPDRLWWVMAEIVIIVAFAVNMVIALKAWAYKGYALREHDITYRSGVVFPTTVTIPYSRLQQVSMKQNPVTRLFALFSVEIVNGAQHLSTLTIPGLTEERAAIIKSIIIEKMKHDAR